MGSKSSKKKVAAAQNKTRASIGLSQNVKPNTDSKQSAEAETSSRPNEKPKIDDKGKPSHDNLETSEKGKQSEAKKLSIISEEIAHAEEKENSEKKESGTIPKSKTQPKAVTEPKKSEEKQKLNDIAGKTKETEDCEKKKDQEVETAVHQHMQYRQNLFKKFSNESSILTNAHITDKTNLLSKSESKPEERVQLYLLHYLLFPNSSEKREVSFSKFEETIKEVFLLPVEELLGRIFDFFTFVNKNVEEKSKLIGVSELLGISFQIENKDLGDAEALLGNKEKFVEYFSSRFSSSDDTNSKELENAYQTFRSKRECF